MTKATTISPEYSLTCPPTHATRRRPERATFGHRLANIAVELGAPFMPMQRFVADVGCEIDPLTGLPAYREIILTVPRQSGKTTLVFCWQIDRCLHWGRVQRCAYTAQSGKDARDKWIDDLFPSIRGSKRLMRLVRSIHEGMGNESITFKTGSRIRVLSTSAASGHSKTLDQAVMDEIWHDEDDRREQGLRPAMVTRADAQLLVCSTAGTQASLVLNRKIEAGRLAAAEDSGHGIAYFEWSAPDGWDPDDELSYFEFMPALCPDPPCRCGAGEGWRHTTTLEILRVERAGMEAPEFLRAYGNRGANSNEHREIPRETWRAVCDPKVAPSDPVSLGLDVSADHSSAAIVAFGGGALELVEHREGTSWLVDRANELTLNHRCKIAIDAGGPAGAFAKQLKRVQKMTGAEVMGACASLLDAIVDDKVRFRSHPGFDAAAAGAAKKHIGDRWVWSRRTSTKDVTPLMAASLAHRARPNAKTKFISTRDQETDPGA